MRKHLNFLGLIVLFAIKPAFSYGQNSKFYFHSLTPDNGLSQASNDYIYHDSKGFVWLSSLDGLNRFDGKSVKVYKSVSGDTTSLLGNIITGNFFEDEQTNLWFTTYEGIHCYVRKTDNFRRFQIKTEKGQILKQDYHAFHLDSKGSLWIRVGIGESGKLYLFDILKNTFQLLCSVDGHQNYPILDKKGNVKEVVSANFQGKSGIEILEVQTPFKIRSFFDGNNKINAFVNHFFAESDSLWYLSTDIGLISFNPEKNSSIIYNKYDNRNIGNILSAVSINDSFLWAATSEESLLIFDKNRKEFVRQIPHEPQKKSGLRINPVNKLYKDQKENVWISSSVSGVNFTNLSKRKFNTPTWSLGQSILSVFETKKGEIFYSNKAGATAYFENAHSEIRYVKKKTPDNISRERILFFFEDKTDNLWAVTGGQLLKWDETLFQFEFVQKLPDYILHVYKNENGRILLATYGGIYEWKKEGDKVSIIPFQALKEHQTALATAVYEDQKGRLYLALDASRLLILSSDGEYYYKSKEFEGIGYAKDFFERDKHLWGGTSTGILKINTEDLSGKMLNEPDDGAPVENYYCIIPDEFDSFWLSCNRGIIRYFPSEKRHRRYTLADGLQGNEYNTNAFMKTRKGEIWMGGTGGMNRFFPNKMQDLPHLPQVQITRFHVNDELYETATQIGELEELSLAWQNNTISFQFTALEYSDPENNQLEYQLENRDEDWVKAEKNGFARYSNLPPGRYEFKVRAANSDGIWNEEPRIIKINIQTPWWKTWWFYSICILAIVAAVYGVLMYRLQQALKIERMRVKISSDLHDDVGGLLAGLTMQSELLELTAAEDRKPKLSRISELSRNAMSRMRDTVWAIDARKDKFENLLDRIREHAEETLELKNIHFDLVVENVASGKNLPTQIRQNLYLICKEAITNTAKHSDGDRLKIKFAKHGRNGILLTIHDNGSVKKTTSTPAGLGLSNMKMRAEQIDAKMKFNTENGFLITVLMP